MTQHILGLLLALAILGAQGFSKQNDASAPPPAPSPAAVAIDPPKAAPAVQPDYPKADKSVPLATYQPFDNKMLIHAYYALADESFDIKHVNAYTGQRFEDGFQLRDMLAKIKPQVEAGIEKAKVNRYYVAELPVGFEPYDFEKGVFRLAKAGESWENKMPDWHYGESVNVFDFDFTNIDILKTVQVKDTDIARKFQNRSGYPNVRIYFFVAGHETRTRNDGSSIKRLRGEIVAAELLEPATSDRGPFRSLMKLPI